MHGHFLTAGQLYDACLSHTLGRGYVIAKPAGAFMQLELRAVFACKQGRGCPAVHMQAGDGCMHAGRLCMQLGYEKGTDKIACTYVEGCMPG